MAGKVEGKKVAVKSADELIEPFEQPAGKAKPAAASQPTSAPASQPAYVAGKPAQAPSSQPKKGAERFFEPVAKGMELNEDQLLKARNFLHGHVAALEEEREDGAVFRFDPKLPDDVTYAGEPKPQKKLAGAPKAPNDVVLLGMRFTSAYRSQSEKDAYNVARGLSKALYPESASDQFSVLRVGKSFHVLHRENMGLILMRLDSLSEEAPPKKIVEGDEAFLRRMQRTLKKEAPNVEIVYARDVDLRKKGPATK